MRSRARLMVIGLTFSTILVLVIFAQRPIRFTSTDGQMTLSFRPSARWLEVKDLRTRNSSQFRYEDQFYNIDPGAWYAGVRFTDLSGKPIELTVSPSVGVSKLRDVTELNGFGHRFLREPW